MLVRYNPFGELQTIRRNMEDLFGRAAEAWRGEADPAWLTEKSAWSPEVDIYEDKDAYSLSVEVPGLTKADIKVRIEEHRLIVEGERRQEHEETQEGYHRVERRYGKFTRAFVLPEHVAEGKIKADCANGVLKITLPKVDEVKPKQIEVSVH